MSVKPLPDPSKHYHKATETSTRLILFDNIKGALDLKAEEKEDALFDIKVEEVEKN